MSDVFTTNSAHPEILSQASRLLRAFRLQQQPGVLLNHTLSQPMHTPRTKGVCGRVADSGGYWCEEVVGRRMPQHPCQKRQSLSLTMHALDRWTGQLVEVAFLSVSRGSRAPTTPNTRRSHTKASNTSPNKKSTRAYLGKEQLAWQLPSPHRMRRNTALTMMTWGLTKQRWLDADLS